MRLFADPLFIALVLLFLGLTYLAYHLGFRRESKQLPVDAELPSGEFIASMCAALVGILILILFTDVVALQLGEEKAGPYDGMHIIFWVVSTIGSAFIYKWGRLCGADERRTKEEAFLA